jgi:hypothetical protein
MYVKTYGTVVPLPFFYREPIVGNAYWRFHTILNYQVKHTAISVSMVSGNRFVFHNTCSMIQYLKQLCEVATTGVGNFAAPSQISPGSVARPGLENRD